MHFRLNDMICVNMGTFSSFMPQQNIRKLNELNNYFRKAVPVTNDF